MADDQGQGSESNYVTPPMAQILSMPGEAFFNFISTSAESDQVALEAQQSFAILVAASIVRASVSPDRRISITDVKLSSMIHGLRVDLLAHDQPVSLSKRGNETLTAVVTETEASHLYVMQRISGTSWAYDGIIKLPAELRGLSITFFSSGSRKVGRVNFIGKELASAKSWDLDRPIVVTRPITTDTARTSSRSTVICTVWPLVHEATFDCDAPLCRFSHTGDPNDLRDTITSLRAALSIIPDASIASLTSRISLAEALLTNVETLGELHCIGDAVSEAQAAIALIKAGNIPESDQHLPWVMRVYGASLASRFGQTGLKDDIDRAIDSLKLALLKMIPRTPDPESISLAWSNMGSSLMARYLAFSNTEDLEESITSLKLAVKHIPKEGGLKGKLLCDLGSGLASRFSREKTVEDINEGIRCLREGLHLQNPRDPFFAHCLGGLGAALRGQYCLTGDLSTLNEAISILQKSSKIPNRTSPIEVLTQLTGAHIQHFEHTGEVLSLQASMELSRQGVQATQKSGPTLRIRALKNCAHASRYMFGEYNDPDYLREAVDMQEMVVKLTPPKDPTYPVVMSQLAANHQSLFQHSRDVADIKRAIHAMEWAGRKSSPTRPEFPWILGNLGRMFGHLFSVSWDPLDIKKAISLVRRAVRHLDSEDISQPQHLTALANLLVVRHLAQFEFDPQSADLDEALSLLQTAASFTTGEIVRRLAIALEWSEVASSFKGPTQSLAAFDAVVKLITLAAGLDQTIQRRHTLLSKHSSHILEAAVTGLAAERVDKAVEWLEQGRGLVWAQLNSLRTSLDDLRLHCPVLSKRLETVSKKLEAAGAEPRFTNINDMQNASIDEKISIHEQASAHYRLFQEREDIINTIRKTVPAFEHFLLPTPFSTLLESIPPDGPVIVVSVHPKRCDAIALFKNTTHPVHIPLRDFSYSKADALSKASRGTLANGDLRARGYEVAPAPIEHRAIKPIGHGARRSISIEDVLRQLWLAVVKPIVDALSLKRAEGVPKLRVWWCPTGPLSFLPLHAAGIYRGEDLVSLNDYAVSSYIPTINTLAERLKNPRHVPVEDVGVLLVSVPDAPGSTRIPGTEKEVDIIANQFKDSKLRVRRLQRDEATIESALQGMKSYSFIHLACHATQNAAEPLRSGFRLQNGRLDISRIIMANLKSADFAFLSACQTSTGTEELSEEAVHLAAGMLAAGYRGAVATMWSIQDRYAPQVADEFYRELIVRSGEKIEHGIDGACAAYALHHAVRQLRSRIGDSESSLLAWVPYVHFGL